MSGCPEREDDGRVCRLPGDHEGEHDLVWPGYHPCETVGCTTLVAPQMDFCRACLRAQREPHDADCECSLCTGAFV